MPLKKIYFGWLHVVSSTLMGPAELVCPGQSHCLPPLAEPHITHRTSADLLAPDLKITVIKDFIQYKAELRNHCIHVSQQYFALWRLLC